ncbi:MAG: phosphatidylserine decarboxylase [Lachnospiraceae bacterium]|nr:phosphatidylserine decarboxylase [Lachnospiraceae bacterium]
MNFLYRTRPGQMLLRLMMTLRLDRAVVFFLRAGISRLMIPFFIKKHRIDLSLYAKEEYKSWRDFFLRHKKEIVFDAEEGHLVSPCDAYLSAYRIRGDGTLLIKGTRYTLRELTGNYALSGKTAFGKAKALRALSAYEGGCALVLRLSIADYHHYHYFDECVQHPHVYNEGELYSVQPAALKTYPVFALNRRTVSLLRTAHFGRVLQIEVGAFAVGGIVNHYDAGRHARGKEKGHFDLCGSTIVLLFEKDRVRLRGTLREAVSAGREVKVRVGEKIGVADKTVEKRGRRK